MKSKASSTSTLNWSSPIHQLFKGSKSKTADQLTAAGLKTLADLLWVFPLRTQTIPPLSPFDQIELGQYFRGAGKILSVQAKPNFRAKGKGRALLQNMTVIVQDIHSPLHLHLKWFNAYGSVTAKLRSLEKILFTGVVQAFNGTLQIVNPETQEFDDQLQTQTELLVQYPTVNKVSPHHFAKVIKKIPENLWDNIQESLPTKLLERHKLSSLPTAFKTLHGRFDPDAYESDIITQAQERLIYEEFFVDQIKILLRREKITSPVAPKITTKKDDLKKISSLFPFTLTADQNAAIEAILTDMATSKPMMRLIQGDVGCGKTAVAFVASMVVTQNNYQVALMCPTESLAFQHYQNARSLLKDCKIAYLVGSLKPAQKKALQEAIKNGEYDFLIGTHALIQEAVEFKNLGLAIIDEQHKFGVEQRLKLVKKGSGTHCLIMTATPIPRSLSLTQYGDLDITTIKSMPTGRKGHKTRIITKSTIDKYYSFLMTRLTMGEQAYVVVPAIEESEFHDLQNLNQVLELYSTLFSDFKVAGLHGRLTTEEKQTILTDFKEHKIHLLIATSVIEVGIDVPNATVLAIINPERFGLSSLHQLRGRVGRGDKPGFCFLVAEAPLSAESTERLRVIENHTDGFIIAEEDLKLRGEGDLFGKDQSGSITQRRLANILLHQKQLEMARADALELWEKSREDLGFYLDKWSDEESVFFTV